MRRASLIADGAAGAGVALAGALTALDTDLAQQAAAISPPVLVGLGVAVFVQLRALLGRLDGLLERLEYVTDHSPVLVGPVSSTPSRGEGRIPDGPRGGG